MVLSKFVKYASIGVLGLIVFGEVYHHVALKIREKLKVFDDDEELTEIVFCSEPKNYNSRLLQKVTFHREPVEHTTEILENLIRSANRTIHLAMYIFTSDPLAKALIEAHKNGVKVAVIIDHSMKNSSGTKIYILHQSGISVRVHDSGTMHHKLCLIDVPFDKKKPIQPSVKKPPFSGIRIPEKGVTITGSLNWTRDALLSNEENFLVTTNKAVGEQSYRVFTKLWEASKAIDP